MCHLRLGRMRIDNVSPHPGVDQLIVMPSTVAVELFIPGHATRGALLLARVIQKGTRITPTITPLLSRATHHLAGRRPILRTCNGWGGQRKGRRLEPNLHYFNFLGYVTNPIFSIFRPLINESATKSTLLGKIQHMADGKH